MIKVKKIACKSLKGRGVNSGLRLIYAHIEAEKRIVFIELFHKNEKENEDRFRIFLQQALPGESIISLSGLTI